MGRLKPLLSDEHPFYVLGKGFIPASELKANDQVVNLDYQVLTVVSNKRLDEAMPMYNFEVADYHTYAVSEQNVWVHNDCFDKLVQGLNISKDSLNKNFSRFKVNGEYFKFGSHHTEGQWYSKLELRGWGKASFEKTLSSGITKPGWNKVTDSPATWRLLEKNSDMRILIDNATKEIIHVGGKGFGY